MKLDAIKIDPRIRIALIERTKELELTQAQIVEDAEKRGYKGINRPNLSAYFSDKFVEKGNLSAQHILWLCFRYCIEIHLQVNKVVYSDKRAEAGLKLFEKHGK